MKPIKLLLCFFALFACIIVRAQQISTVNINGIYYDLYADIKNHVFTAEVHGSVRDGSSNLIIPSTCRYNLPEGEFDFTVVGIADYAFKDRGLLKSITIPNTVTSIGASAFENCALNSLIIPNSVTSIGHKAFAGCHNLTSINIPNSVNFIDQNAFDGCSGATEIRIGTGVKSIADYTFRNCSGATNIYIHTSTSSIGKYAFAGCSSLTSIHIWAASIGDHAFYGCSDLKTAYISQSVTSIGDFAFGDCYNLLEVTANNPTPITISNKVFPSEIPILIVPEGSQAAYKAAGGWMYFLNILAKTPISFADVNVKALCVENWDIDFDRQLSKDEAARVANLGTVFRDNSTITSFNELQYFTGLCSIETNAFNGCTELTSVTIPSNVTSIGDDAFAGCTRLTSVTINNPIPVIISDDVFPNRANSTLYVPAGCKTVYESADYWKDFKGIVEMPSIIKFTDANVKDICVANWDNNHDGELSEVEAAAVTDLGYVFQGNTAITSFNEFQYFTGVINIRDASFYNCKGLTSVTIPNSVTTIGSSTFKNCSHLTSVTIPNSVTTIKYSAFENCTSLTSVTIPNSVTTIGSSTFKNCSHLTSVTIPNSVTAIGSSMFENCTGLTSIDIPNSVTTIGSSAFYNCSHLTSVTIPNSVTSIGQEGFRDCTGLTSLTIGNSVTTIESLAFCDCYSLTSATIPNSVTTIGEHAFRDCRLTSVHITDVAAWCQIVFSGNDSNPLYYANHLFMDGKEITDLVIPNSVTIIGDYVFSGYTSLTSVTIPNSVSTIGKYAFSGCSSLTSVTIENPKPVSISKDVFRGANAILYVPACCKVFYSAADYWKDFKEIVEMEDTSSTINFADVNVKNICIANWDNNQDGEMSETEAAFVTDLGKVFKGNSTITSFNELQYFTGLTSISNSVFYNCTGLTSVTIPNSVTAIGSSMFENCTGLTSIDIPNSVTTIGSSMFSGCTGLTSIDIPNSVTSIGGGAFYNCTGLTSVTIPNSVTAIGSSMFENCTGLTSIDIPNSVTTIGSSAFQGCTGLTSVTIPNSVTTIGSSAFKGCTGLTSVTIPNSVTSIGGRAFNFCTGLTSVTISNSVTTIESFAFWGCTGLTSVTIPTSVTTIGEHAFYHCSGLLSVTIPTSVTTIGDYAFYGCTGLTSVTIPNNVTSIGDYAFSECSNLASITVEAGNDVYSSKDGVLFNTTRTILIAYPAGKSDASYSIPNSVTGIGNGAFGCCTGLTSIAIPNSVMSIGNDAFYMCTGLTSIAIPNSVTSIGSSAFYGCSSLPSLTIPNSVTTIEYSAFENCTSLTSVTIPNSVTTIEYSAFQDCTSLTSVTIPNSVTSIGNYAFFDCYGLTSVKIDNKTPLLIYSNTFSSCHKATLYVPAGSKAAYEVANYWKLFKNIVETEDFSPAIIFADANVKSLCVANWDTNGDGELSKTEAAAVTDLGEVFKGNSTITSFNELQYFMGLTEIANSSFSSCINLTSMVIPINVTTIGVSAFNSCIRLSSITLPESIISIGVSAFLDCNSLTSIHIPASVTTIGIMAFNVQTIDYTSHGYPSVRASITVAEGNTKYDSRGNCNAIIEKETNTLLYGGSKTVIPESVTSISGIAFCNSTITSITIPNNVKSIGNAAFLYCKNLTSVTIESTTPITIGNNVFSNRTNATLYVPRGCKTAYESADVWKEFREIKEIGVPVSATGISLNETALTLTSIGQTTTLVATITPSDATNKKVTWSSDNEAVATVDDNGIVTAVASGTTIITATTNDGTNLTASCLVAVSLYGDINMDGKVNGGDIVSVINYVLDDNIQGDVNGDGRVNGADIVAIINYVLDSDGVREYVNRICKKRDDIDRMVADMNAIHTAKGIIFNLIGGESFTAFQMTITLPEGVGLNGVDGCRKRIGKHKLLFRKQEDGKYLVLGFAADNSCFEGDAGEFLTLLINGRMAGTAIVTDILFFTPNAETKQLEDISIDMETGIEEEIVERLKGNKENKVFDISGRPVISAQKNGNKAPSLGSGIYIKDGRKYVVK